MLPSELRARLVQLGRAAYPHEACGSILGLRDGPRTLACELYPARNLERDRPRERYLLHPADQLAAEEHALALGLEIVGYWHTHPDRPARASEADRISAWENHSYLVLSIRARGPVELRSFRLARSVLTDVLTESARSVLTEEEVLSE